VLPFQGLLSPVGKVETSKVILLRESTMPKAYKVLTSGLQAPYRPDFRYELGKEYICSDFDEDHTKNCSRGFYATPSVEGLLYANLAKSRKAFECVVEGKVVNCDRFKVRWEKIKIVREIPEEEVRDLAKAEGKVRGYNIEEALYPLDPFKIKPPKIMAEHKKLLAKWISVYGSVSGSVGSVSSVYDSVSSVYDSVSASVYDSVRDSVSASVRDSVYDSLREALRDSARYSVWASMDAYISSLFPNIEEWKYFDHPKGTNPFQPCIDLWRMGLVPYYYYGKWYLFSSEGKENIWVSSV
jgi:hypothetical protein